MEQLSQKQYQQIQSLLERYTGIHLAQHKKHMVENRLMACLRDAQCDNYDDYLSLVSEIERGPVQQKFIDKLTTHETYFFRESYQFELLKQLLPQCGFQYPVKAWSAASSTGEEAYSIAMLMDDTLGYANWSVLGTDVSLDSVSRAKEGMYELSLSERIPLEYRVRYCLRGVEHNSGQFTLCEQIKRFCRFQQMNLLAPDLSQLFDVIFLRNVLIYFDSQRQHQILNRVVDQLAPGGLLFLGHSENIIKRSGHLRQVDNCTYRKSIQ